MTTPPLEDPTYTPKYPPVDGAPPAVVAKWGPRSQLRWFARFVDVLRPNKWAFWDQFHCSSEHHTGNCCGSCIADQEGGYDYPPEDDDGNPLCCCRAIKDL